MTVTTPRATTEELERLDAWWRTANYLAVGQIYLLANPLLREPLRPEHVKPRLLGHWGTTPGLNLVFAHASRVVKARDLAGLDGILFRRNSQSGALEAVQRQGVGVELNAALHAN